MDLKQLHYFVTVADEGSISGGAKKLFLSQPPLSIQLKSLEEELGCILFERGPRNITLTELPAFLKGPFLNEKKENLVSKDLAERVDTKAVTVFDKASSLSGGNQQKVVVAKALGSDFKLLILDEPTKGVDVGAKAAIYEIMGELAQQGYAIIMISSEMPEILGMSDRIIVMCEGRVTGELSREEATQEKILELAMTKLTAVEGSV